MDAAFEVREIVAPAAGVVGDAASAGVERTVVDDMTVVEFIIVLDALTPAAMAQPERPRQQEPRHEMEVGIDEDFGPLDAMSDEAGGDEEGGWKPVKKHPRQDRHDDRRGGFGEKRGGFGGERRDDRRGGFGGGERREGFGDERRDDRRGGFGGERRSFGGGGGAIDGLMASFGDRGASRGCADP